MLPFAADPPLLPLSVTELKALQDRTGQVVAFVEDQNHVNYPEDLQRLPDAALCAQRLRKHSLTEEACTAALWVEGRSLRLLPVRTGPLASTGLLYASSKPALLDVLVSRFTQRLYRLFSDVEKKNANLESMRKDYADHPWRLEAAGTGVRELAVHFYVTCDLTDYQAHLAEEPRSLFKDEIAGRAEAAWRTLESMAAALPQPAAAETPGAAGIGTTVRRAVDQPAWKAFERSKAGGVSWSQVRQEFGDEMMIRIILRRRDYRQLLSLMRQDDELAKPDLRQYVSGCLAKIRANNDIGADREADFALLEQWLG